MSHLGPEPQEVTDFFNMPPLSPEHQTKVDAEYRARRRREDLQDPTAGYTSDELDYLANRCR